MRWPNDERLAAEVDEIDLFLGGHDHDYNKKLVIEIMYVAFLLC